MENTIAPTEGTAPHAILHQRLLVVEDEPAMAELLQQALTECGFTVTLAENGAAALELDLPQDAMIVDIMMPKLNGLDLVTELRKRGNSTPVLFLTAKGETSDMVKGFEVGADDYMVKPFKLDELVARLRALIRRSLSYRDELHYADVTLDRRARTVRRGEKRIYLSATEFSLLELFLMHPCEVIPKSKILKEVWSEGDFRDENVVEVYMNYLRGKLEGADQPRLIQTIRGKGYVLETRDAQPH